MNIRNKSGIFFFQVFLLVFVFISGVLSPSDVSARMYRTSGSGMAEGDPGDGDDSMGGGGGGSTPEGIPAESVTPKYPTIIFSSDLALLSYCNGTPVFVSPVTDSMVKDFGTTSIPIPGYGGSK